MVTENADPDAVLSYLDALSTASREALLEAAANLQGAERERYLSLAYRRGMSPLGRAKALSPAEDAELARIEAVLHDNQG